MRYVFTICLLATVQFALFAQEEPLTLTYGEQKKFPRNITLPADGKLQLSLTSALTNNQLAEFLDKSKITVVDSNGSVSFSATLRTRITESGENPDSLFPDKSITNYNLIPLFGNLDGKKEIHFFPFLGLDKQNKPVMDPDSGITIHLTAKSKPDPPEKPVDPKPNNNDTVLQNRLKEVTELQRKLEEELAIIKTDQQNLATVAKNMTSLFDLSQMDEKKRREIEKEFKKHREDQQAIEDFSDCSGCADQHGDLIYDFRCKLLFKAERIAVPGKVGEKIKYVTLYHLVSDLTSVIVKAQYLVRLKVVGINRYLYNVDVKVEDSIYGSEPPKLFSQFFSGSSDLFTKLSTEGENGFFHSGSFDKEQKNVIKALFAELQAAFNKFKPQYNKLLDMQTKAFQYCLDKSIACCDDANSLPTFSYYEQLLSDVLLKFAEIESQYLSEIPSATELIAKINKLQTDIETCTKNIAVANDELKATVSGSEAEKKAKEKLLKANEGNCSEEGMKKLRGDLEKLKSTLPIRNALDAMRNSLPTLEQLRKLYMFDRNIVKDHFFYRLPPIYPQGDNLKISINMQARDSTIAAQMGFMPTYHDDFNLAFSVRNKTTFSFSSGPFFAFGGKLSNKTYGFKRIPVSGTVVGNDARFVLEETGNAPLPIGLGGFAHIGVKMTRNFGIAGTIGAGYSFNQGAPLPVFMGGVTTSAGDRQRLSLSFGIAAAQVKELKKDLYIGNVYAAQPTLEYDKPVKMGWWVGVTYSIFTSTSKVTLFSKSKK